MRLSPPLKMQKKTRRDERGRWHKNKKQLVKDRCNYWSADVRTVAGDSHS